jgi:mRNA interferase MazF
MNRGDIFWVEIPDKNPRGREIAKTRPCVVVSVAALNTHRSTVIMIPLSSNNKAYPPISISVSSAGEGSVAVCDQLLAVDKKRLTKAAGKLTRSEMREIDESLRTLLGL